MHNYTGLSLSQEAVIKITDYIETITISHWPFHKVDCLKGNKKTNKPKIV